MNTHLKRIPLTITAITLTCLLSMVSMANGQQMHKAPQAPQSHAKRADRADNADRADHAKAADRVKGRLKHADQSHAEQAERAKQANQLVLDTQKVSKKNDKKKTTPKKFDDDKLKKGVWTPLFNGKNLDGWTPKITGYKLGENHGNLFRVEDGLLKVVYDKESYEKFGGRFGHLFYKHQFSNYILRVEYRFVGEQVAGGPGWAFRNSGLMIHGQSAKSMEKTQKFPVSIEVQTLGGNGKGKRPTANLCTPGTNVVYKGKLQTRHCFNSTSKTYHGDQWVTIEIEVHGNKSIKHKTIDNGKSTTVFEYTNPQLDPKDKDGKKLIKEAGGDLMLYGGTISLQAESHPVEYRKVEIKILDK